MHLSILLYIERYSFKIHIQKTLYKDPQIHGFQGFVLLTYRVCITDCEACVNGGTHCVHEGQGTTSGINLGLFLFVAGLCWFSTTCARLACLWPSRVFPVSTSHFFTRTSWLQTLMLSHQAFPRVPGIWTQVLKPTWLTKPTEPPHQANNTQALPRPDW